MKASRKNPPRRALAVLAATIAVAALGHMTGSDPLLLGGRDAHAIVGRPLTPMSYAGVARRTTRRAVYAGAAYGQAYPAARPYAPGVVTALPGGCGPYAGGYYTCGAVRYRPYYQGGVVVYAPM